ncbi:MAG: hypothetical protein OD816_000302 [Thermodesulfobacterium sp.]|uniref:Uncharacterized protein n=1 Tax=Candidatus Thermodesulfobacterium syntrophicum TaxID=3060442 RepID=A0AAE3P0U4_9BACT|nr:hypothetical protein [Candidatus Thermodesulfobacterium syntrophicum]
MKMNFMLTEILKLIHREGTSSTTFRFGAIALGQQADM